MKKVKKLVNKSNYEYPTWNIFSIPNKFKIRKFKLISEYRGLKIKHLRTTLDTKDDLKFLRTVSKKLKLKPGENNLLKLLKNSKFSIDSAINIKTHKKVAYKIIKQRKSI